MMRPKRTKPDANQPQIVADLRGLGAVVWILAGIGGRVLDLAVFWRGLALPVEVKMPGQEYRLTAGEIASIEELRRVGIEPCVATCVEDVVEAFETMALEEDDITPTTRLMLKSVAAEGDTNGGWERMPFADDIVNIVEEGRPGQACHAPVDTTPSTGHQRRR